MAQNFEDVDEFVEISCPLTVEITQLWEDLNMLVIGIFCQLE